MCARCVQGVHKMCARCAKDVCKMCARCVQDVCKSCARCLQDVRKMCARCAQYVFNILRLHLWRDWRWPNDSNPLFLCMCDTYVLTYLVFLYDSRPGLRTFWITSLCFWIHNSHKRWFCFYNKYLILFTQIQVFLFGHICQQFACKYVFAILFFDLSHTIHVQLCSVVTFWTVLQSWPDKMLHVLYLIQFDLYAFFIYKFWIFLTYLWIIYWQDCCFVTQQIHCL